MRLTHRLLLAACAALLAGCSTSNSELEQDITFTSNVERAMVEIDGTRVGRTPIRVALDRTRNHRVVIGKSGYKPFEIVLRPSLQGGYYGFIENMKAELGADTDAPSDIPEEDLPEFNRAKALADAPIGADPATYGTLAGDLDEARQSADRLAKAAVAAKRGVDVAEEKLAKALAAAKAETESGATAAVARLENTEQALRNALAEAEAAAQRVEKMREVVAVRIAFLESLQGKSDTSPKQATEAAEAVNAAKREAAEAEAKAAATRNTVAEATAALKAATEARAKASADNASGRLESLVKASEVNRANAAEFAAKIEGASRVIAARVEELGRQVAEEKSGRSETVAALEAARKENAELAAELAAVKLVAAKAAADSADKALAAANEKVEALERQLAESRLSHEAAGKNTEKALAEAGEKTASLERQLAESRAAQEAAAKAAADNADRTKSEIQEKAAALERQLAESRLALEAKLRENRARAYAEYTARKGLLERALRSGELSKEGYQEALVSLDKELRSR